MITVHSSIYPLARHSIRTVAVFALVSFSAVAGTNYIHSDQALRTPNPKTAAEFGSIDLDKALSLSSDSASFYYHRALRRSFAAEWQGAIGVQMTSKS